MKKSLILYCWGIFTTSIAQPPFATGLEFDPADLARLRKKETYRNMNKALAMASSLKDFALKPLKQVGETCVAHAFAHAYSIQANRLRRATSAAQKETARYSHYYIYEFIKKTKVQDCSSKVRFSEAIAGIQAYGIVSAQLYSGDCGTTAPPEVVRVGKSQRPTDLPSLFDLNTSDAAKITSVKRALQEQKPVVAGWAIDENLQTAKEVWEVTGIIIGGHAMTIVGYDDTKFGGAFEIQNSWGENWGNKGFIWVRYNDFVKNCQIAVEVPALNETVPPHQPLPQPKPLELRLSLRDAKDNLIPLNKVASIPSIEAKNRGIEKRAKIQNAHFIVARPMYSRESYQLWLEVAEPTFVYVLATDASNQVACLFPDATQSALLAQGQDIKLPSSEHVFVLDDTKGMDYMCILLSKEALDIEMLRKNIEQKHQNSFLSSVETVLGEKLINTQALMGMSEEALKVTAQQRQTVLPVMIQIEHQ